MLKNLVAEIYVRPIKTFYAFATNCASLVKSGRHVAVFSVSPLFLPRVRNALCIRNADLRNGFCFVLRPFLQTHEMDEKRVSN